MQARRRTSGVKGCPLLNERVRNSESDAVHESVRLAALRSYDILDTPPDGTFDRVTALAARIFNTPIALVSLVDEDRIWFKSRHGLAADEIGRDPGLCASAIFSPDTYVIRDVLSDPRTLANSLVAGECGLRFYAAAPLVTRDGFRLGTLNVIDFEARDFTEEDQRTLAELAGAVMDQMELRISSRKAVRSLLTLSRHAPGQDAEEGLGTKGTTTICAWTKSVLVDGDWMTLEAMTHGPGGRPLAGEEGGPRRSVEAAGVRVAGPSPVSSTGHRSAYLPQSDPIFHSVKDGTPSEMETPRPTPRIAGALAPSR